MNALIPSACCVTFISCEEPENEAFHRLGGGGWGRHDTIETREPSKVDLQEFLMSRRYKSTMEDYVTPGVVELWAEVQDWALA